MVSSYTQTTQPLRLTTPLGDNALVITALEGTASMNQLYCYSVAALSDNSNIEGRMLIGKPAGVSFHHKTGPPRYFHGVVSQFEAGHVLASGMRTYRLALVPWLWLLTHQRDCRIFQNQSIIDITRTLFSENNFSDYQLSGVRQVHEKRECCTQYNETTAAFLQRLWCEEGLFFYFLHSKNKHVLYLGDSAAAYQQCQPAEIAFSVGTHLDNHISQWEHRYDFVSGKHVLTDYNFESPSTQLLSSNNAAIQAVGAEHYERFSYPGRYTQKPKGDALTKQTAQAFEALQQYICGASNCPALMPGLRFKLNNKLMTNESGDYVLTQVHHRIINPVYFSASSPTSSQSYQNDFQCILADHVFRQPVTEKHARIFGTQTAKVVGPSGEEIFTDQYGRIKVQFHWDRYGQSNEKSSCWIRVAQGMAGNKWGHQFVPRVGQEVVVSFLEGDPDKPLAIGVVYNADNMPPYALPAHATQSGIKMHSTKGGSVEQGNEIRLEDKKENELIYLHAQKDLQTAIENDNTLTVKHDFTATIDNNFSTCVNKEYTLDVKQSAATSVHGDYTNTVAQGNYQLTVKLGDIAATASMGDIKLQAMKSIELSVGANSIKIDQSGITLNGLMIKLSGQTMAQISGGAMLTLKGGIVMVN